MYNHVVVGHLGEVGSALYRVLDYAGPDDELVLGIDQHQALPARPPGPLALHVCIGWSDTFTTTVAGYAHLLEPDLVIVHSTVKPGTCDANGWVHSPIRGRHPHLDAGILKFTKHLAGPGATDAATIFTTRGINTRIHDRATTTEVGKLTELLQYGVEIAMMQRIHALATMYDVPFDEAYTDMSATYNAGYTRLGHEQFTKPILTYMPPADGGHDEIGGHCIKPAGVALLGAEFFNGLLDPLEIHDYTRTPEPDRLPGEVPLW